MILLCNGTIMSCGDNCCGQLGCDGILQRTRFEEIKDLPKNISSNACGQFHTVILLRDGGIMSCGYNGLGELGHGDKVDRMVFEVVNGIPRDVREIICGTFSTIRLSNGKVMSCGYNGYGQLGHGDTKNRLLFDDIKGIPNNTSEIFCSGEHTVIRLTDCRLMSCGQNKQNIFQRLKE